MEKLKRILLVEPDACDRFILADTLRDVSQKLVYDVAKNGKEALEMLEKTVTPPDLIFMTTKMPVMDGIECLSTIIKNPKTKEIPVVILSDAPKEKEIVEKLGAKAFLEKLRDYNMFKNQIEQIVNQTLFADSNLSH